MTAADINFGKTVGGPFDLITTTVNETSFHGTVGVIGALYDADGNPTGTTLSKLASLTATAGSTLDRGIQLFADVTTTGAQLFLTPVVVNNDIVLHSDILNPSVSALTFRATIDNPNDAQRFRLTLDTKGNTELFGDVGSTHALQDLSTVSNDLADLYANITTVADQTYQDNVTLHVRNGSVGEPLMLTSLGGNIIFEGKIDGSRALYLVTGSNGLKDLQDAVGSAVPLTSLWTGVSGGGPNNAITRIHAECADRYLPDVQRRRHPRTGDARRWPSD